MQHFAFIGLGAMGLPIASRLARKADVKVRAYDPDKAACERLGILAPVEIAESAADAAKGAQLVGACLPDADAAKFVFGSLAGPDAAGQVWMDFSTHDVTTALGLAEMASGAGAHFVEAPLIGGIPQAEGGTLHVLISSTLIAAGEELPDPVQTVIAAVATKAHFCGPPGHASAMKALQNGLGLMQLAAIAETIAACDSVGIDPRSFSDFVQEAPGMANTGLFARVASAMNACDAPVSAKLAIAEKDMRIARDLMRDNGARSDMASLAANLFAEAKSLGLAGKDFSRIVEIYRKSVR